MNHVKGLQDEAETMRSRVQSMEQEVVRLQREDMTRAPPVVEGRIPATIEEQAKPSAGGDVSTSIGRFDCMEENRTTPVCFAKECLNWQ
jgi:hypothetical protein